MSPGLIDRHAGQRICVMGGGPSLAADVVRVQADVWISANHHGAALRAVDYVVALDDVHDQLHRPMRDVIRQHTAAPIIAPHPWADIRLADWPLGLPLTGPVACWVAAAMGARQIVLAGFDCYGAKERAVMSHRTYTEYINATGQRVPYKLRAVSGPLLDVYAPYEPEAVCVGLDLASKSDIVGRTDMVAGGARA
jgi:hypothetical protein